MSATVAALDRKADLMPTQYVDEERVQPVRMVESDGTTVPMGALDDAAWDGTGNPASLVALLKGCYAQLAQIAENTTPTP